MTATLPDSVIEFFEQYCGLSKIEASSQDIQQRDSWREVELRVLGRKVKNGYEWNEKDTIGLCEVVKEAWESWTGLSLGELPKIIVFVNTVDRAIALYDALRGGKLTGNPIILLAHSRFTKSDKERVQEKIACYFGKDATNEPAILVSTQASEAGLNISAPLVITELCPMDSLIQRAGRCQRFKPKNGNKRRGLVIVVKPKGEDKGKWYAPYLELVRITKNGRNPVLLSLSEITQKVLENNDGKVLTWDTEKSLINAALNDAYRAFLQGTNELNCEDIQEEPLRTLYQERRRKRKDEEEHQGGDYAEEAEPTEG